MIADSISKRYAKALVSVAANNQELELQAQQLKAVLATIEGNNELKDFLTNPVVSREHKKGTLNPLVERLGVSASLKSFLLLLAEKDRLKGLDNILRWHKELVDERMNRAHAKVTAARPLGETERQALLNKLSEITQKQISIEEHVDPNLIGGVVAQIGSTIYDGSVRRQLAMIKEELIKE